MMQDVVLHNIEVSGPQHAVMVANDACRTALGERGVAHLTIDEGIDPISNNAKGVCGAPSDQGLHDNLCRRLVFRERRRGLRRH